jgi:AcrR family transcriptional regulator
MVYRRQQRRGSDTKMHPTYEKILTTAVEVLIEQGFDRFNVQDVLDRADVSRGTLYHHYGDVDALIESALAASYARENRANVAAVAALVERCKTPTEFRREVKRLTEQFAESPSSVRIRRVHTIALCQTRPYLDEAIRAEQDAITAEWTELIQNAQSRGFIRADVDAREGALLVQGIHISRIVDEVSSEPLSNAIWARFVFSVLETMLLD